MVLAELGGRITHAIHQIRNATIIDEKALNECLNEITRALLQSDVSFSLVKEMQTNIKKIVNLQDLAAGHNKHRIIEQVFFFTVDSLFLYFEILSLLILVLFLSLRLSSVNCVRCLIRESLPLPPKRPNLV